MAPWRLLLMTPAERDGGSIVGTAMLMALMLAFAPVALLGGSSMRLMLRPRYGRWTCGRRALGGLSFREVPLALAPSSVSGAGFLQ